jgi:hypothetical protein
MVHKGTGQEQDFGKLPGTEVFLSANLPGIQFKTVSDPFEDIMARASGAAVSNVTIS